MAGGHAGSQGDNTSIMTRLLAAGIRRFPEVRYREVGEAGARGGDQGGIGTSQLSGVLPGATLTIVNILFIIGIDDTLVRQRRDGAVFRHR